MDQLPLEIVQHIITAAIPPPNPFHDHRADFLLPLCYLHSSLRPILQRLLFAHPLIVDTTSLRLFLRSIEKGNVNLKGWVKSLDMGDYRRFDDTNVTQQLEMIIVSCPNITEVSLRCFEGVDLAILAQLKNLRSLTLAVDNLTFRPVAGQASSFASLVDLCFLASARSTLPADSFFTLSVLPVLTRLSIASGSWDGENDFAIDDLDDLDAVAGQLMHLEINAPEEDLAPLLAKCKNLRSLNIESSAVMSSTRRSSRPLIGLRIWRVPGTLLEDVHELMEAAFESNLVDRKSSIFLRNMSAFDEEGSELGEWADSTGLSLHYRESALEQEWEPNMDDGFSKFTDWVDAEEARRVAAAKKGE